MGVCNPVIDALVERVINASSRDKLLTATHALDRVLLWNWYIVPHWHLQSFRVAYWDRFARPRATRYAPALISRRGGSIRKRPAATESARRRGA